MIPLTSSERKVFLFLSFLIILGLGLSVFHKTHGSKVSLCEGFVEARASKPLNLNDATHKELVALPGVGETTARAILKERVARGGFKDVAELKHVKGIGDVKLARLKERLCVE
jgi:competence ComEA-like helix-hairpin-helix protein